MSFFLFRVWFSGFWVSAIGWRIGTIAGIAVRHHGYVVDCSLWGGWHDSWVAVRAAGLGQRSLVCLRPRHTNCL